MKLRPLKNQVLISLLPLEANAGSIFLPDVAREDPLGQKHRPRKGVVVAIGEWRKTKAGFAILPDFQPGDTVLISDYSGAKLTRNIGENYRLCRVEDVLAVVTKNGDSQAT